jgi:hypothetical protein
MPRSTPSRKKPSPAAKLADAFRRDDLARLKRARRLEAAVRHEARQLAADLRRTDQALEALSVTLTARLDFAVPESPEKV